MTREELQARSGATRGQLNHWIDKRWLPSDQRRKAGPGGKGGKRLAGYTQADLVASKAAVSAVAKYGRSAAREVFSRLKAEEK